MKKKKNKRKKKLEKKKRSSNKAVEKNQEVEEKQESEKKRGRERFLKIIFAIGGGIISILGVLIPAIEFYRNEQILKPEFSLERNVEGDGSLIWKIYNSGGAISNAIIYPTMYVTFFFYDEEQDEDIDITLEILGYYDENNYPYNYSDAAFYVKDDKQSEINDFIEKYTNLFCLNDIEKYDACLTPYFTLNYKDYKGKKYNRIYTVSDNDFIDDNSDREIFGEDFSQLQEVSKIIDSDIIVPSKFEEPCVISINYKNATTKQIIESEQEYEGYLGLAFLNLIDSKDKPVEDMLGELILTKDGTAYIQDMEIEIQEEKVE